MNYAAVDRPTSGLTNIKTSLLGPFQTHAGHENLTSQGNGAWAFVKHLSQAFQTKLELQAVETEKGRYKNMASSKLS